MPDTILAPRDISRAIDRAIKFLGVMSLSPPIRRILAAAGYDDRAHAEGWGLALQVMGYTAPPPAPDAWRAPEQERAVGELDQMDGPTWGRSPTCGSSSTA